MPPTAPDQPASAAAERPAAPAPAADAGGAGSRFLSLAPSAAKAPPARAVAEPTSARATTPCLENAPSPPLTLPVSAQRPTPTPQESVKSIFRHRHAFRAQHYEGLRDSGLDLRLPERDPGARRDGENAPPADRAFAWLEHHNGPECRSPLDHVPEIDTIDERKTKGSLAFVLDDAAADPVAELQREIGAVRHVDCLRGPAEHPACRNPTRGRGCRCVAPGGRRDRGKAAAYLLRSTGGARRTHRPSDEFRRRRTSTLVRMAAVSISTQERELVDAARAGDETAFGRLVEEHRAELQAHCYRMLGSLYDAEDALQETLLRAWRGLPDFGGRSSLRTWLYRIATNASLDAIARRPKRVLPIDYGPMATPSAN